MFFPPALTALIDALHGEGYSWRGMKNVPRVVRAGEDCDLPRMHLIGVVDIPDIHGIQFVRISLQNDPVLLSSSYRDARQVRRFHQRATAAEDRQGGESPRLH